MTALDRLLRFWCWASGHRFVFSQRGEPVTRPHLVCVRCGKLGEL